MCLKKIIISIFYFEGQLPFQMPSVNPIGGNNGAQGIDN